MRKNFYFTLIFIIVYSLYVLKIQFKIDNYSDIIVATTFFFTLFSGFFITRQNDRYTAIADEISNTDGLFSLLYRISGTVPNAQKKVKLALKEHYQKILDNNNWAYHILHPSTTITQIFNAYKDVSDDDAEKIGQFGDAYGGAFLSLQTSRKRMAMLYDQKLLPLQWSIVYILGFLVVLSFNFIPNYTILVGILKVIFAVAVFFVILLLRQLDDLSIFGKEFNKRTANDILRIIEEKDMEETKALEKKKRS